MLTTPVCIIGAGPAGTVASLFLSKNQVPHILVDRASFPREKVCGELYDGRLYSVLNKLDPELIKRMKAQNIIQYITKYSYVNSDCKSLHVDIPLGKTARMSTYRPNFDSFLLDEALKSPFVQYFEQKNIQKCDITEGGVTLMSADKTFIVDCQTAILATGVNSPLTKTFMPNNQDMGHFLLAARGYYSHVEKMEEQDTAHIFLFKNKIPYYIYMVYLPNNLVTLESFILKEVAVKYQVRPEILLAESIKEHKILRNLFKNAQLEGKILGAAMPKTTFGEPLSTDRILLAGSCGSSVNPATGWGVGHAVFGAMCAAEQYVASAKTNDFSAKAFKNYDKRVYKALQHDQLMGKAFDLSFRYGYRLIDRVLGFVSDKPLLSKKIGHMINDF